ncbi:unnamed protein product [Toxocara canis]|uniref:Transposase n=1 Tax=Toxocara canis TaxID=6265 RepID=A0A183UC34_TOXCA|nr:unnamed protein product [Toxocara canis]
MHEGVSEDKMSACAFFTEFKIPIRWETDPIVFVCMRRVDWPGGLLEIFLRLVALNTTLKIDCNILRFVLPLNELAALVG